MQSRERLINYNFERLHESLLGMAGVLFAKKKQAKILTDLKEEASTFS